MPMNKLVLGLVGVALMVSPAMASQCPLLIKQLNERVMKMKADDPRLKRGIALMTEAQRLHDAGQHAEAVAKAEAAAKVLGVKLEKKM